MMKPNPDETWLRRAVALLDAEDRLEPEDAARLRRARARALARERGRGLRPGWQVALPSAALALTVLGALVVGIRHLAPNAPTPQFPAPEQLALLAGDEGLGFYDDLEFVEWLEFRRHERL